MLTIKITTNFNRCQLFGPYIPPFVHQALHYRWTNLCGESESVTGLFYDVLSVQCSFAIGSIGITTVTDEHPGPRFIPRIQVPRSVLKLSGVMADGHFLSVASLRDVSRLEVCRVESRCIGIGIYHHDGSVEVLGQWEPLYRSDVIYPRTKHCDVFESLTFYSNTSVIDEITVNDRSLTAQSRTFTIGQVCMLFETRIVFNISIDNCLVVRREVRRCFSLGWHNTRNQLRKTSKGNFGAGINNEKSTIQLRIYLLSFAFRLQVKGVVENTSLFHSICPARSNSSIDINSCPVPPLRF